ncbi:MAG: AI-2E family transporter [Clostridiales bacterium]|nr:AI-2E family transporter [Clostridiales bacterium]
MQHTLDRRRALPWIIAGGAAVLLLRDVLAALAMQLLAAWLLMALALPVCRLLEKRLSPGLSAALSFLILAALALGMLLGLIPPIIRQFQQLAADFPALLTWGRELLTKAQAFLQARGIDLAPLREELFSQLSQRVGALLTGAAQAVKQAVQAAGKLFLAPLFAFYLLRDRRRIASAMELLIPVRYRARAVRAAREMRRETVNFLRGQLMLSLSVGTLTAVGLLAAGTPGWLVLGLLMGVMELVPYIGPVIAGIPAVLLALQGGWLSALWTLGILLLVQQIESGLLSPRFLSGATRLHPLLVLLTISAGGMLGGPLGMVAALPAVVSLRGALRGWRP